MCVLVDFDAHTGKFLINIQESNLVINMRIAVLLDTLKTYFQIFYRKCTYLNLLKVGLSPSKEISCICFNESVVKMMENAFYFILNAFFGLKISEFLS